MSKVCVNKKCIHKGVRQPTSNFYRKFMTKDGLDPECKDCKKIRQNETKKIAAKRKEDEFGMFMTYTKGYQ